MNLESLDPERVESALLDNGALSVTLTDAGDDPVLEPAPGETPLWTRTRVTALFDAASDVSKLPDRLRNLLDISDLPAHHFETLEDRVWEREWLSDFGPMQFGKHLWVIPGEEAAPADDAVVVRLDPGLAFGTGTHATTALCLGWLDDTDLAGKTVFDFGCGSGILGIAALKLGASHVEAVDIDLQAVSATRQNAERNGVAGTLQVGSDTRQATGDFDIIVANILAGTLIDNAGAICDLSRRDGRIALSGILTHQADSVINAFRERVTFDPPAVMGEWVLLTGKRN
jgi:ribosomal protein L11 methyltransferase